MFTFFNIITDGIYAVGFATIGNRSVTGLELKWENPLQEIPYFVYQNIWDVPGVLIGAENAAV